MFSQKCNIVMDSLQIDFSPYLCNALHSITSLVTEIYQKLNETLGEDVSNRTEFRGFHFLAFRERFTRERYDLASPRPSTLRRYAQRDLRIPGGDREPLATGAAILGRLRSAGGGSR